MNVVDMARGRRPAVVFSCVWLVSMFLPTEARGGGQATWTPPSNVRIVQKDGADNVRTFLTIGAAMASISDASASNPYLVKVMPGTYDSAGMKPYVSVEGSGAAKTVLTNATGFAVTNATVRELSIASTYAAVYLADGATLERVVAQTYYAYPVAITGTGVRISDSVLEADCSYAPSATGIYGGIPFVFVRSKAKGCAYGMTLNGLSGDTIIVDSEIEGQTGFSLESVGVQGRIVVRRSIVAAPTVATMNSGAGAILLAGSEITGSTAALRPGTDKMVSCHDGDFNPLPSF